MKPVIIEIISEISKPKWPVLESNIPFTQEDDQLRFFHETQDQLCSMLAAQGPDLSFSDLEAIEEGA